MFVDIAGADRSWWKWMYSELSANTVAFISCRGTLTKVLAGAARGKTGSKGGGGRVRLLDVDTWELAHSASPTLTSRFPTNGTC